MQQHPSSYQKSKDRLTGLEAALRAELAPEQVQAALARGEAGELWETVAEMLISLADRSLPGDPIQGDDQMIEDITTDERLVTRS